MDQPNNNATVFMLCFSVYFFLLNGNTLKCRNIFCVGDKNIKIGDLGLATFTCDTAGINHSKNLTHLRGDNSRVGTPIYLAPEVN